MVSIPRRRRRTWWAGNDLAATPFLGWNGAGDGRVAAVCARKLAAALWRWAETTDGGGGRIGWQCGLIRRLGVEIPQLATEGVTKWDHLYSKASSHDACYSPDRVKHLKRREIATAFVASPRRVKVSRSRKPQHEKMISIVESLRDSVRRERTICKKIDKANSKLVHDIAEVRSSARKVINNLQKEKRARLLVEDVCVELAKEIEANWTAIDALKKQRKRIEKEVAKERKMLQLAEVWREERAQMKLKDARLMLEHNFAEMSHLIANLQNISRNADFTRDVTSASIPNILRQDPESINIQGTKEVSCLLPKSDHKFKIIKEYSQRTEEEDGKNALSKGLSNGDLETVTQAEVSSSQNLGEISHEEGSVYKIRRSKPPKSDSSGITSVSMKQPKKKGSYALKVQRNLPRNKEMSSKRIPIPGHDLSGNPHVVRAMKGHIEWPRELRRPGSGGGNLLETKLENQKMLTRNILKRRS